MSARPAVVSLLVSQVSVTDNMSKDLDVTKSARAGAFDRIERAFIVPTRRAWAGPGFTLTSPARSNSIEARRLGC